MFEWAKCSEESAKVDDEATAEGANDEADSAGNAAAEAPRPECGGSAGSVPSVLHSTTCSAVRSSTFGSTTCRWRFLGVTF